MKWNQDIAVLDLETTDDEANRRIIQVGCTYLHRIDLSITNSFDMLVNPELPISEYVTGITRIKNSDVKDQPPIATVLEDWEKVTIGCCGSTKRCRLACWGNYFDVNVLRDEYKRIGRKYSWSGTVIDVKSLALTWLALSGRGTSKKTGLGNVAETMGIDLAAGQQYHDALTDAFVTAQVFQRIVADFKNSIWLEYPKGYKQVTVVGGALR